MFVNLTDMEVKLEKETVEVVLVDRLASDLGIADLDRHLAAAGIDIIATADRRFILDIAWKRFLREAILLAAKQRDVAGNSPIPDRGLPGKWPKFAVDFTNYVRQHEPETMVEEHKTTITLKLPGGRWGGLQVRGQALLLYAFRKDQDGLQERIATPDDFEKALNGLRQLSPRARRGHLPVGKRGR